MRLTFWRKDRSHRRGRAGLLAVVPALALVTLFGPAAVAPAAHAAAADESGAQKVVVFEDVTIGVGEVRENLVVVGGDVLIHGVVQNVVVVVGGDLVVASDATVGSQAFHTGNDAAIVSVFGDLVVEDGATVMGKVVDVGAGGSIPIEAMVVDPIVTPWNDWNAIVGWIGSTAFILLVALLIAAVAPRQLVFVSERARRHLFSSLGWGALCLIILLPILTVLLIVTLIGILAVLPWWLANVVALLFGYVGVGTLIGRLILGRSEARGRVIGAAVLGVAVLCIVRWVPFFGALVVFFALLLGLGATVTSIWEWRRLKRMGRSAVPPGGYGPTDGTWTAPGTPYAGSWPQNPPTDQPPNG